MFKLLEEKKSLWKKLQGCTNGKRERAFQTGQKLYTDLKKNLIEQITGHCAFNLVNLVGMKRQSNNEWYRCRVLIRIDSNNKPGGKHLSLLDDINCVSIHWIHVLS